MSTDLQERLTGAVGDVVPRPVDTAELWRRGRRQRRVRQVAPVVAVLTVLAVGVGAVVAAVDLPEPDPLAPIGDGRTVPGWSELPAGAVIDVDALTVASEDDVELATPLLGHPVTSGGFDVRADGAVVTVFHDRERGGLVVWHPQDAGWTRIGMPVPFLEDDQGYAVHSVEWGPDGRIYLTGMAPTAEGRGRGLTQVVALEEDGTVVGVRENDAGQHVGFLYVDGVAWQRQHSDGDGERWQPVAELGQRVLPMPEQRAGEWTAAVAPDGMVARGDWVGEPDAQLELEVRVDERRFAWRVEDRHAGLTLPDPGPRPGVRTGFLAVSRPASGPLSWLNGEREPDGVVVLTIHAEGRLRAVHLPAEVVGDGWHLAQGGETRLGADGHLYWIGHDDRGAPVLLRYRHPLP